MGGGIPGTVVAPAQAVKRSHAMPFGAEVLAAGGVRFRLWAPAAKTVDVVIARRPKSMRPQGEGDRKSVV